MIRHFIALLILFALFQSCLPAQPNDMKSYNGDWEAELSARTFSHQLTFTPEASNQWRVKMGNEAFSHEQLLSSSGEKGQVALELGDVLRFSGELSEDEKVLSGFLQTTYTKFRLTLRDNGKGGYSGKWNSFYVPKLQPAKLYLSIENGEGNNYEAYPILPDNRYRGTYADDFQKSADEISFIDRRTGYSFKGFLRGDTILMEVYIGGGKVGGMSFTRSTEDWKIGATTDYSPEEPRHPDLENDGWPTGPLAKVSNSEASLDRMVDSIEAEALTHVHSVLMAHQGTLVYENYFNGFQPDLPHDQRSAAKSFASAIIGIALEDGVFQDVNDALYDYLPEDYQATKDEQKARITLKHLLTMSSGLDAIDFGIDRVGQATEDNYQMTRDWIETVLTAPMIYEPGEHCNYGSANPFLLGVALDHALEEPVEDYFHERLFGPLGIENYSIPIDPDGRFYFGGGTYLGPRDMLKFGELYRQGGVWKGKQILSPSWIEQSFTQYGVLENTSEKNGYGYLFWLRSYQVGERKVRAYEARGAGGQYICIIPDLELVIVITSGNYRNGRYWQPEVIIEEYLLPVFAE
ncbi:serine hydrolase domain-containing protein [Neolewinella agarilytica]|uniref:serine hydrolase domain-containing protein n=1 Tax=Neolewinella agarilytica TaxID=478744 RepID=UPI002355E7A7|nr:serine hydrolase [Neolewinella agarilytica]